MAERRDKPNIWMTWLTKLLVGENSCEWAAVSTLVKTNPLKLVGNAFS